MIVYIVIISDTENEFFSIHSVYSKEAEAVGMVKALESTLQEEMVVTYEAHEVQE